MNFEYTDQQIAIQAAISKICDQFGDDYWLARDTDGAFPEDFVKAITEIAKTLKKRSSSSMAV